MNSKRRRNLKRAQLKKEKNKPNTASQFMERIKINEEAAEAKRIADEKNTAFENKVKKITSDFSLDLEDAMIMFSKKKGMPKFTFEEFVKYQSMIKILNEKLNQHKGNYTQAYQDILKDDTTYSRDSIEYRILNQALTGRINREEDEER